MKMINIYFLFVVFLIIVIFISFISAFTVTTFTDDSSIGNFTYNASGSQYKNLSINQDANITVATIDLKGYGKYDVINATGQKTGVSYGTPSALGSTDGDAYNVSNNNVESGVGSTGNNDIRFVSYTGINPQWRVLIDEGTNINGDENTTIDCSSQSGYGDNPVTVQDASSGFTTNTTICIKSIHGLYARIVFFDNRSRFNYTIWNKTTYPTNLTIKTNNEITYENIAVFDSNVDNLDLNKTSLQGCVNSCSNSDENDCICEINFTSFTSGILEYSDINITWDDIKNPTWQSNKTNNTYPKIGDTLQFNITIIDGFNLSHFIFSTNGTGSWTNDSAVDVSGETNKTIILNKTIPQLNGNLTAWTVYFNDTSSNQNQTDIFTLSINITDPTLYQNGISNFTQSVVAGDSVSFVLSLQHSNDQTFNYTMQNGSLTNVTIGFNPSKLLVTNQTVNTTTVQINVTSTRASGTYEFNITANRTDYDNRGYNFPIILTVVNQRAIIKYINTSGWVETGYSDTTYTKILVINNSGDYNASNCTFDITKAGGTGNLNSFLSQNESLFSIENGTNKTVSVSITNPSALAYSSEYLRLTCSGTNANDDVTTNPNIEMTFTISTRPSPGGTTGGGGGGVTVIKQCTTTEDCITKFGEKYVCIENFCIYREYGPVCNYDGICDPSIGENIFSCGDKFDEENNVIIEGDCDPLSLENWVSMAFTSKIFLGIVVFGIIGGMIYLQTQKKKPKFRKKKFKFRGRIKA